MSLQRQKSLVNALQNILQKQINLARQGHISNVKNLTARSNSIAEQIAAEKILEKNEFKTHKKQLRKAYEDLTMALKVQKDDIEEKVTRIRKGKKTVKAYRKNI